MTERRQQADTSSEDSHFPVKEDALESTFTKQSISHETAQKMVAAAVAKAQELGVPQVVAILDESGLLKAFCRMDGARVG